MKFRSKRWFEDVGTDRYTHASGEGGDEPPVLIAEEADDPRDPKRKKQGSNSTHSRTRLKENNTGCNQENAFAGEGQGALKGPGFGVAQRLVEIVLLFK
jgi:hypothetical protein